MTQTSQRRSSSPRKKQASLNEHDDAVPLIPVWVREWGWVILAPVGLVLAFISYAVGSRDGQVPGWTLFMAPLAVAAALCWQGYQHRLRVRRVQRDRELYERSEFPRIDAMDWKEFEHYCADLLDALDYEDVKVIGSGPEDKGLDILATAPDGTRVGVQVKHRRPSEKTGRMPRIEAGELRGLYGAVMGGQHAVDAGILMTNTFVQPGGWEYAALTGLTIRDRSGGLGEWMSQATQNAAARIAPPVAAGGGALGQLRPETRLTVGVACAAAIAVVAVVIDALAAGSVQAKATVPSATTSASASSSPIARPVRSSNPAEVIREYYAAISRHDWPQVWHLGGRNLGTGQYATYSGMMSGYKGTIRDVLTEVNVSGQTVTGRFLAYQVDDVIQPYRFRYVVSGGVIVSGDQYQPAKQEQG